MNNYTIAILIPHYNNLSGLGASLASIDTTIPFKVFIVDDGSSKEHQPSLYKLLKNLHISKEQVSIIYLSKNKGVENALNAGLKAIKSEAKAKYILRMDTGDLCVNNRIETQHTFLEEHKDICLVGSWVEYIDTNGTHLFNLRLPVSHDEIKRNMIIKISFIHSAVMFRFSAIDLVGYYSNQYQAAEDYAYFYKFIKVCKTANIPEILTQVEWNVSGLSVSRRRRQLFSRLKLTFEHAQFSFMFVYAIFRLLLMLIIPYSIIERVKKKSYS